MHLFLKYFHVLLMCVTGVSSWEAKDWASGGHDERAASSHGERAGEHAGESTGKLPGASSHADKGEATVFALLKWPQISYFWLFCRKVTRTATCKGKSNFPCFCVEWCRSESYCLCAVSAGEGAAGKPDLTAAAGEQYPEGRCQLSHQPDGEQVG